MKNLSLVLNVNARTLTELDFVSGRFVSRINMAKWGARRTTVRSIPSVPSASPLSDRGRFEREELLQRMPWSGHLRIRKCFHRSFYLLMQFLEPVPVFASND